MEVREILCRSILTRTSGYLKQVCSHSLNPYSGCGFGQSACGKGCYVQFNRWLVQGREWGKFVDVKINAAEVYSQTALREKNWALKRGRKFSVFFSSSTDPWQPVEKKYRITRNILRAMQDFPPEGLILQTHSPLLLDDMDLILSLSSICDLRVHISVEGDCDDFPGFPPPPSPVESRLKVLEELSNHGIQSVACLSPLYPMTDPEAFFSRLNRMGVSAVVIDHFIEGDGTLDGSRTLKTGLPEAMAKVNPDSVHLSYRDKIASIARRYLPVGISAEGFGGNYSPFPR